MVRKIKGKYYVYSKDGKKRLGGPYATQKQANKRIGQIEFFKRHKQSL